MCAFYSDTVLRLGLFFNMDPRFWLNLQTGYDMRVDWHAWPTAKNRGLTASPECIQDQT